VVELDDLKAIILLSHLTDPMLEKLVDITLTILCNYRGQSRARTGKDRKCPGDDGYHRPRSHIRLFRFG
jgi:hypothetical protein